MSAPADPRPGNMARPAAPLASSWGLVLLRGLFAILFGVLALVMPGVTLASLVLLFGAYMIVDGIVALVAAVGAVRRHGRWSSLLLEAVVDLLAGGVALAWPLATVLAFVLLAAVWAIVSGAFLTVAAFRLHGVHGRWWMAAAGVASVAWGVLLAMWPVAGAVVLGWWIGAYALVFGGSLVALALTLRRHRPAVAGPGLAAHGV